MSISSAIFYGIFYGFTQFLPISSTGHFALIQHFFGGINLNGGSSFHVFLLLGTVLGVFFAYAKEILRLCYEFTNIIGALFRGNPLALKQYPYRKLCVLLLLSCLPMLLLVLLKGSVASFAKSTIFVGVFMCINAAVLHMTDIQHEGKKTLKETRLPDGIKLGMAGVLGMLPGLSLIGTTLCASTLFGFRKSFGVKFAVLMSVPFMLSTSSLHITAFAAVPKEQWIPFLLGAFAAGIASFFAIKLLTMLAYNGNFKIFSYYCFVIGLASVILSLLK